MGVRKHVEKILEMIIGVCISFSLGVISVLFLAYKRIKYGSDIFNVHLRETPPAILHDAKWGTHRYVTLKKQGIKLHYVENGNRNSPLLLFLHGFPESWFSWRHQLAEFASDFWVVAVDMRGYGDSDKPSSVSDYDIDVIAEDIKEFIQGLEHPNCTLVAHDWGGPIAWLLVSKYPDMFKRHVSINAPHPIVYRKVSRTNFTQFLNMWYIFFFQNRILPEVIFSLNDFEALKEVFRSPKGDLVAFPDDVMEAYKYFAQKSGNLTYPIHWYRRNFSRPPPPECHHKVTVPTLIIWGVEDVAICPEIGKGMTKVCTDVQLRLVEGAGHFVHEEEPKHVNGLIRNYLTITNDG